MHTYYSSNCTIFKNKIHYFIIYITSKYRFLNPNSCLLLHYNTYRLYYLRLIESVIIGVTLNEGVL